MSHHFSPEFTVLPSGKEPVSKKLQRNNEKSNSAKRRETEQLQFDNKQLEWKLSQLRQVMSKEKEDRGKQGNIWKSGNARIESHSRNILGRTVSGNSSATTKHKKSPKSPNKSPNRVRILKDEPLDLPQRDSLSKDLIRRFNSDIPPENASRKKEEPIRQLEHWIKFSLDKNNSDVFDLQSNLEGNLELSAVKAMNSAAIGVYFMKWGRKRLLIAAEGVIRKPKTGWGDEIYYPYTVKCQSEPPMRPEPPSKAISNKPFITSPQPPKRRENGGALLQGSFDEEANAASFQQALIEWRSAKPSEERSPMKPVETSVLNGRKATPEMSVHVAQCTPEPFDVKFSETSTLSYMEHILLQKHRESDISPLPRSLTDTVNDYLDPSYEKDKKDEMNVFTTEEEEERARYRQLFSPQRITNATNSITGVQFQEVDCDDWEEETDDCIIEESPPPTPTLSSAESNVTVKIEEVTYHMESLSQRNSNGCSSPPENLLAEHQEDEYKENYDPVINMKSCYTFEGSHTSDKASPLLFHNGLNNGISYHASSILHEIGQIPINPDAFYSKGLDSFFVQSSPDDSETVKSQFQNFEGKQTLVKLQQAWNPLTSVPHENHHPIVSEPSPERDASTVVDSKQSNYVSSDGIDNVRHLSAKNSIHYDINSESDDSADERALDDLEWELASQMGNITSDGRISRLIDEWPEEGDLDIIDDPGCGSGLSTPDENSTRPSRLATPYNENDSQMQYDFHNMEHIMMDDLNDEYVGDEV